MHLVLQSFGNEKEYRRALLTIFSYLAFAGIPKNGPQIILFTDDRSYFERFLPDLIIYVPLTPEKIKEMRGQIDFQHRMKIALIDEAFTICKDKILYLDSDAFFRSDPTGLASRVDASHSIMHTPEYKFERLQYAHLAGGEPFEAFYKLITSTSFRMADGSPITVSTDLYSWNAGVMVFDYAHHKLLPDVYALTDQFYIPTKNHASEQFAFSVVLQTRTKISGCENEVYHYWYKVLKNITDTYLAEHMNTSWERKSTEEKIRDAKKWCRELEYLFKKDVRIVRDNAMHAFHQLDYRRGFAWSIKGLTYFKAGYFSFVRDVLYHCRQFIKGVFSR